MRLGLPDPKRMKATPMLRSTKLLLACLFTVFGFLSASCGSDASTPVVPSTPTMAPFAGNVDGSGNADGTGTAARFNRPGDVATDSAGNVYLADTSNDTIRKITSAGVVTTLAGTAGVSGSTDATGAAASFQSPYGIATDSAGNVYVADTGNHTIRKITSAGVVTTLAGTAGVSGSTDATGAAASFRDPRGIATDSAGNVYVADSDNDTIRKITPAGEVTTLAGAAGQNGFTPGALPGGLPRPRCITVFGKTLYFTSENGVVSITNLP